MTSTGFANYKSQGLEMNGTSVIMSYKECFMGCETVKITARMTSPTHMEGQYIFGSDQPAAFFADKQAN